MGSSSSKVVQTASKFASSTAPKAARKFPKRSPPPSTSHRAEASRPTNIARAGQVAHPEAYNKQPKDEATQRNASDPDIALNERLRQLGPINLNPTHSNSSTAHPASTAHTNADPSTTPQTFRPSPSNPSQTIYPTRNSNPAVSLLTARYRLAEEADREFAETGRSTHRGRSFIDAVTLRQMLVLREQGVKDGEIERRLHLKEGVVGRLGRPGLVGVAR